MLLHNWVIYFMAVMHPFVILQKKHKLDKTESSTDTQNLILQNVLGLYLRLFFAAAESFCFTEP